MVRFGNDIDGVELEPGQSIKDENGNEVLTVTEDGTVVSTSELSSDTVSTEFVDILPTNVAIIPDFHYPGTFTGGGFPGRTDLESRLDSMIAEINDWGAEHVILLGDAIHEQDTQSATETELNTLINDYLSNIDGEWHIVLGNHEYGRTDEGWPTDWFFDEWGFTSIDDTWYTVDVGNAVLMILNNSYTESGVHHQEWPQAEIDWMEQELNKIDKPVYLFTHHPLSVGNGEYYDHAEGEEKVGKLISRHNNIVCSIFGHVHHDSNASDNNGGNYPNPFFDQPRSQPAYGMQHIGIPWIYRLQWDDSYNIWGQLKIQQDGLGKLDMSYKGQDTGCRETFDFRNQTQGVHRPSEQRFIDWNTHFESLDGFQTDITGGSSIQITDRGVEMTAGATSGDYAEMWYIHDFAGGVSMNAGWENAIWRLYIRFEEISNANIDLLWGNQNRSFLGWFIRDQDCQAVTGTNGSVVEQRPVSTIPTNRSNTYSMYYVDEMDRVDYIRGRNYDRPKIGNSTANMPDLTGSAHIFRVRIEATDGVAAPQTIRLMDAEMKKGPNLDVRQ